MKFASIAVSSSFQIPCFFASFSTSIINHFNSLSFCFPLFRWFTSTVVNKLSGAMQCFSSAQTHDNHITAHMPWGKTQPSGTWQNFPAVKYTFDLSSCHHLFTASFSSVWCSNCLWTPPISCHTASSSAWNNSQILASDITQPICLSSKSAIIWCCHPLHSAPLLHSFYPCCIARIKQMDVSILSMWFDSVSFTGLGCMGRLADCCSFRNSKLELCFKGWCLMFFFGHLTQRLELPIPHRLPIIDLACDYLLGAWCFCFVKTWHVYNTIQGAIHFA